MTATDVGVVQDEVVEDALEVVVEVLAVVEEALEVVDELEPAGKCTSSVAMAREKRAGEISNLDRRCHCPATERWDRRFWAGRKPWTLRGCR